MLLANGVTRNLLALFWKRLLFLAVCLQYVQFVPSFELRSPFTSEQYFSPMLILQRLRRHLDNQNWFAVGLEMGIVMMSVFLAFQVDSWNERRKNRNTEEIYLQELLEDFQTNRELEDHVQMRMLTILPQMHALLKQSALKKSDWPVRELNAAFSNVNQMPTYHTTDRVYNNLLGSGDLKLIQNRDLKNALAQYYSNYNLLSIVQNTHELILVDIIQPYVVEYMDFQAIHFPRAADFPVSASAEPDQILKELHTRRFRNVLTTKWDILTDLLDLNREVSKNIDSVIAILETEVGDS